MNLDPMTLGRRPGGRPGCDDIRAAPAVNCTARVLVIMWVPTLIYGLLTGFNWISGILFALITILMLFGSVVDNIVMGQRARAQGASWAAITVSLIAGLAAA